MAVLSDLHNHVVPFLPGAETTMIDYQSRRVLREFFKRTTVWREVFEFNTTAGVATYSLQPTAGIVAHVMQVFVDGKQAVPVPEDRRDMQAAAVEKPTGWYSLLPQVLTLYPAPIGVVPVKVEAALTLDVAEAAPTYPDDVLNEHAEAIAAGVIGAMMLMPGKPWTQSEHGTMYSRIFGSAVRETRGKLRDGGQPNQSTFIAARRFGV